MPRTLEGLASLDRAIDRARRMAARKRTTIDVQGCRTRGDVLGNEEHNDFRRAAKVSPCGLVLSWAIGRYVSIPED